ncbi:MAG: hypothetical protein AB1925_27065 [Actinomycetota bacterium]
MTEMPEGWSVDVDGANIVVSFPGGDQDGRRVLSRHDARVLRVQLHLAYLLAGRNRWSTGVELGATSEEVAALRAVMQDHPDLRGADITYQVAAELLERLKAYVGHNLERIPPSAMSAEPVSTAPVTEPGGAAAPGELPRGWSIRARGHQVEFIVPASAADGYFDLRIEEALAVGVAITQQAERARLAWLEARQRAIEETSGSLSSAFEPDELRDARKDWSE